MVGRGNLGEPIVGTNRHGAATSCHGIATGLSDPRNDKGRAALPSLSLRGPRGAQRRGGTRQSQGTGYTNQPAYSGDELPEDCRVTPSGFLAMTTEELQYQICHCEGAKRLRQSRGSIDADCICLQRETNGLPYKHERKCKRPCRGDQWSPVAVPIRMPFPFSAKFFDIRGNHCGPSFVLYTRCCGIDIIFFKKP